TSFEVELSKIRDKVWKAEEQENPLQPRNSRIRLPDTELLRSKGSGEGKVSSESASHHIARLRFELEGADLPRGRSLASSVPPAASQPRGREDVALPCGCRAASDASGAVGTSGAGTGNEDAPGQSRKKEARPRLTLAELVVLRVLASPLDVFDVPFVGFGPSGRGGGWAPGGLRKHARLDRAPGTARNP
ncbi:hypothetical protein THAOC_01685, partial [Thalassiosira oceanica]